MCLVWETEDRERGVVKVNKNKDHFLENLTSQGCGWAQWEGLMGWLGVHGMEGVLDRDEGWMRKCVAGERAFTTMEMKRGWVGGDLVSH